MIIAQNISVQATRKTILQDVSCEISSGITCILGPNGAGKSTLLKCLSGGLYPDKGTVFLDQKPFTKWPAKDLAKRRAVLGQNLDVGFPFKAIDIVMMGRAPHVVGRETRHDCDIAEQALEAMDASDLKERIYTTLSGGEKQRIQIARVLTQIDFNQNDLNGHYLFLDEPISALDLKHQKALKNLLIDLKAKSLSILCVVHDINYACAIANQLFLMKSGSLKEQVKNLTKSNLENIYDIEIKEFKSENEKHTTYVI